MSLKNVGELCSKLGELSPKTMSLNCPVDKLIAYRMTVYVNLAVLACFFCVFFFLLRFNKKKSRPISYNSSMV